MISSHEPTAPEVDALRAELARTVLLRAALVGDITDLRDLMARRATTAGDDYTIPALVTADGVAAALTTILNQEQS